MTLSSSFNDTHSPRREKDSVLSISVDRFRYLYDFSLRLLTIENTYNGGSTQVLPFSQLDRETLVEMRDKLIELQGKPPELPAEAPVNPGNLRRLNP